MKQSFVIYLTLYSVCASAQFTSLATTDDGSRLYFVSRLALKGSGQPNHGKVFFADDSGVRLFEMYAPEQVVCPAEGPFGMARFSSHFDLQGVSVSADGSMLAITGRRLCNCSSSCGADESYQTTIHDYGRGSVASYGGQGYLSGNGRFALLRRVDITSSERSRVIDQATGTTTDLTYDYGFGLFYPTGRMVADDGSALWLHGFQLMLRRAGVDSRIDGGFLSADGTAAASIIPSGATVVSIGYSRAQANYQVVTTDTLTGSTRILLASPDELTQPSLSNDGRRLLVLSAAQTDAAPAGLPQPCLFDIETGTLTRLSAHAGGVSAAVLSGDGRVAWFLTALGSLVKFNLETLTGKEIAPRTPALDSRFGSATPRSLLTSLFYGAPGSLLTVTGSGLSPWRVEASTAQPPYTLAGTKVTVGGRPAPILSASPGMLRFQVPWESGGSAVYPADGLDVELRVDTDAPSLFDTAPAVLRLLRVGPAFERLTSKDLPGGEPWAQAYHEGLGGPITKTNPAQPGEQIRVLATGLGPVEPSAETGRPAPATDAPRLVAPPECKWNGQPPAPLDFAGLAPLLVGLYQITLRLPDVATGPSVSLLCNVPSDFGGGTITARIPLAVAGQ